MYTLDIKKMRIVYLILTIVCGVFSAVYEYFSHGVLSPFMICPGIILFVFGFIIVSFTYKLYDSISFKLYNSTLSIVIVGSYIKGVLDIYGTTNNLWYVYPIAALVFGILFHIFLVKSLLHE